MRMQLLKVAVGFLLFILGLACAALYVAAGKVNVLMLELKSSESNARVGWASFYDLQDKDRDAEVTESGKLRVDVWNLQRQLDTCQNTALAKK